jgi:hypothetical protein
VAVPLTLKVFKGEDLVATRDYDRDIIKIGRLASAHLCLDDEKVSRIHSVLEVSADGKVSIIDMGSVEGTYVNGKRVNKGPVAFGDEIRVGNTRIKVETATQQAAANLAAATSLAREDATQVTRVSPSAAPAPEAPATPAPAPIPPPAAVQAAPPEPPPAAPVAMPMEEPAVSEETQVGYEAPPPADEPEPAKPARRARAAAPQTPPTPRTTGGHGKEDDRPTGPLGLEVRLMWGDQMVGEHFLETGKPSTFTVGSDAGVDFLMGDAKLGAPSFEAVKGDGHAFSLRFNKKMPGELTRGGTTLDLKSAVDTGKASNDGDAYSLTLDHGDFAWVDLGNVRLEAMHAYKPKPAVMPWTEGLDYRALYTFAAVFFIGLLFVVGALNREAEGDQFADELNNSNSLITKLLIKPPDEKQNKFLQELEKDKSKKPESTAAASGAEGQMGRKDVSKDKTGRAAPKAIDKNSKDIARMMVSKVFGGKGGGITTLFGRAGLGGELNAAMGGMMGKTVGDAFGTGGLGLKGGGGGGGGTGNTIGIGAVGTRGVAGGTGGYGMGSMGKKSSIDPSITSSNPEVMGSLDPELIRRVIRSHVDQVRYCYELQLPRFPHLKTKIAVRFIITGTGNVATASIATSTVPNAELEQCIAGRVHTWVFPKPKGGGTVVVTYPFILQQAGE